MGDPMNASVLYIVIMTSSINSNRLV